MGVCLIQGCCPNNHLEINNEDSFENITRANSRKNENFGPLNKIINFEEILFNYNIEEKDEKKLIKKIKEINLNEE